MSDIEKARQVFEKAGLAFPTIPEKLAEQLTEQSKWVFSTRPIDEWPYLLHSYVEEAEKSEVDDYAVLCHAGHGVNSYAIHYYLVQDSLRMFLQLGWGGIYSNPDEDAARIRDCFSLADQIASVVKSMGRFHAGNHLTVVVSNFAGSYWLPPGKSRRANDGRSEDPLAVLKEALAWLKKNRSRKVKKEEDCEIGPKLGLHHLGNPKASGSFKFHLSNTTRSIQCILKNLGSLIENTVKTAPNRDARKDFKLSRKPNLKGVRPVEAQWERAMHKKWGPEGTDSFVPIICERIQTYQYPLRADRKDLKPGESNECWGKIDLLGVGNDGLPVPIELKKAKTCDSLLRMVVEVAAYGFALQKVWPNLREHWAEALSWFKGSPPQFLEKLGRVTLVCVAPQEYWDRCLGLQSNTKEGEFPSEAWPFLWELVDAFKERGFEIHFAVVEGTPDNITGAKELDREWFSRKQAGCKPGRRQ